LSKEKYFLYSLEICPLGFFNSGLFIQSQTLKTSFAHPLKKFLNGPKFGPRIFQYLLVLFCPNFYLVWFFNINGNWVFWAYIFVYFIRLPPGLFWEFKLFNLVFEKTDLIFSWELRKNCFCILEIWSFNVFPRPAPYSNSKKNLNLLLAGKLNFKHGTPKSGTIVFGFFSFTH